MTGRRRQGWVAACAVVAYVLAGCSSPSASPTAPPAAPAKPTEPAKPAATTAPAAAAKPTEPPKPAALAPAATTAPAAAPAAAKPASGDPYRIGVTFPLTGPQAAWGTLIVPVMEIAAKDVNDAGGINGRPLEVVVEDSKGDPQAAVAAMQKLVQVNRVPVVLTIFTNVVTAQAPAAESLKVPIISTIESPGLTDQSQWNFANSVLLTDTLPLLREYWKAKGIKRLYVIIPDTSYATFSAPLLAQAAKDLGAEYGESRFKLGETDYRGLAARVKDFNPDAILVTGHGTLDEPLIMRQAREIGIQTPFYSACGCPTAKNYRDALGEVGDGLIFAMLRYDKQAAAKVIGAYRARLGFDPDYAGIEWYDIVQMVAQAIKTKGYTGDGIRQGLAEIKDFPSVGGGKLSFDQNRQSHQAVALYQLKGTDYTEIKPW